MVPQSFLIPTVQDRLRSAAAGEDVSPAAGQLLEHCAIEAAEVRRLLDDLAELLVNNDLEGAKARVTKVLEPIYAYEQALNRFATAQNVINQALASAPQLLQPSQPHDFAIVHSSASSLAAAFDELAEASQALKALQG